VAAIWSKIAATQIVAANEGSIAATLGLPLLRREKKKKTKQKQNKKKQNKTKIQKVISGDHKVVAIFYFKKAKTWLLFCQKQWRP
jgi:hypothetical protein